MVEDARLLRDGVTTGVAIAVLIDGENTDAALDFTSDVNALLDENGLQGEVGGDLPVGAEVARAFEEARVTQILLAGMAIFLVTWLVLDDYERAARIAIGTIAVGAAVDGMSGFLGGRGIFSAPAVLLGMGFAADYLAHASADHAPTRSDTAARWWSALTSISVFVLLGFATFPPARDSGQLLTISILFSVLLATCLSLTRLVELKDPGPASPPPTSNEDAESQSVAGRAWRPRSSSRGERPIDCLRPAKTEPRNNSIAMAKAQRTAHTVLFSTIQRWRVVAHGACF
ncbi:MAG TPA: hypothetical protein EYQ80_02185 [Candidatus Poseidoniales archaeon]|nr:hypothetical protein [Candidatus Poseidoniales archaeon]